MTFVVNAAFPRLAYRLRWPTRLGPRALVAYIAVTAAFLFALRVWVVPWLGRLGEARVRAELTERLGREPTGEELAARVAEVERLVR
jgi:hypothetical protein